MPLLARCLAYCLIGSAVCWCQPVVISDVTVINPRDRSVQTHRTVIIEGDRVRSIGPASLPVPKGAQVINGKQKFLIPGLWDAHVHLTKTGVLSLPLFVANGVTGVRDMGSDFAEVDGWRKRIAAGELVGPRIKTSGQILESAANVARMKREATLEPVDRIRIGVGNPDEARRAVDRLAAAGVDHIKMRTTPDLQTFQAAAEAARRHQLPFTAHPVATPDQLIAAAKGSIEHFLSYPALNNMTDAERRALLSRMAKSGLYLSNTMSNIPGLLATPYAEGKRIVEDTNGTVEPRRKYLCGYLIRDWREQLEENKDSPYDELRKDLPNMYRDFREMREQGVPYLAGTDAGVIFVYPGFSLHDELAALVRDVGFTPMEALRVATDGIPRFYGETAGYGAVAPGAVADLVLLDADPAADIHNTRRIAAVSWRGKWLDRAKLDGLLRQVEQAARANCSELGNE